MFRLFPLIAAVLLAGTVHAETVTLRGNNNVAPKAWQEGSTPRGYAVDAAVAVLREAGLQPEVKLAPFAQAMELALTDGGVVTGVFHTKERAEKYLFSSNLVDDTVLVVVKKGKEFKLDTAADLAGKRVGYQEGARFGQEFEDAVKSFTSVTDNDPKVRLKRLLDGELDAAIINPGLGALAMNSKAAGLEMREFSALPTPIALLPNYMVMAKGPANEATMARINAAIKKLSADGTLQKIRANYDH